MVILLLACVYKHTDWFLVSPVSHSCSCTKEPTDRILHTDRQIGGCIVIDFRNHFEIFITDESLDVQSIGAIRIRYAENLIRTDILGGGFQRPYKVPGVQRVLPGFVQEVCIRCRGIHDIIHCQRSTLGLILLMMPVFYKIDYQFVDAFSLFYFLSPFGCSVADTGLVCFVIDHKNLHHIV